MADDVATDPITEQQVGPIRELRLALVCYGGVSLAIYMHGTTKEIHKLVLASEGRRLSPATNPFPERTTEHVYYDVLARLEKDDGIPTRVVVDIISGTSAGGINGVFLAKALAGNLDQTGLRQLWLEQGDIHKLTKPAGIPVPLRFGWWLAGAAARRFNGKPPLNGDFLLEQAYGALKGMNGASVPVGGVRPDTLMPDDHDLKLFVTTTDFDGYQRMTPAYAPIQVPSEWHRHIYAFEKTSSHDAFRSPYDPALAFAARSTSSFPGAFPPANLADVAGRLHVDLPEGFDEEFFPTYRLAGRRPEDAWFVDGGVLDNFPFRAAIDAIFRMPASSEVDRRLLYIEPDPGGQRAAAAADPGVADPGFLRTVIGSLSSIPANQPIAGALIDLRDFNDRVDRIADMVRVAYDTIDAEVANAAATAEKGEKDLNAAVHDQAADMGPSYKSYVRLKVGAVVDALAEAASSMCGFPQDTDQAAFVTDVLRRWAGTRGPLRPDATGDEVVAFLKTFDLGYAERRLKFVLKGLNALYGDADAPGASPNRQALDHCKARLWNLIGRIEKVAAPLRSPSPGGGGDVGQLQEGVQAMFSPGDLTHAMSTSENTWDDVVGTFEDRVGTRLDDLRTGLGRYLEESLEGFGDDASEAVTNETENWSNERAKRDLRLRFTGFPLWDAILYPMQKVADLGELNRVEVVRMSPVDATALDPSVTKLSGVGFHHFGAFFDPKGRANDYVWGRLDGAERLIWLLLHDARTKGTAAPDPSRLQDLCRQAFNAITSEEASLRATAPEPFDAVDNASSRPQATATPGAPPARS